MAGKNLIPVILIRSAYPDITAWKRFLTLEIFSEKAEHGAVPHIMSIDNSVAVLEVTAVSILNKDRTCRIIVSFKGMMEIVIIVCSLYHRIADFRTFNLNPCDDIRIYPFQALPVHSGRHRLFCLFSFCTLLVTGIFLYILPATVILLGSFLIFQQYSSQL